MIGCRCSLQHFDAERRRYSSAFFRNRLKHDKNQVRSVAAACVSARAGWSSRFLALRSKNAIKRKWQAQSVSDHIADFSHQQQQQQLNQLPQLQPELPFIEWSKKGKGKKRTDLKKIMILGAGPIVIGQACEFDYSGTQACKALKEEGYEVVLVNSNPATIMTDPELADRTYITPMIPELVERVLEKERPDALLPTMGGQTALNLAVALAESGALEKYGVELIGAKLDAIRKAEDRDLFRRAMQKIGVKSSPSGIATTLEECFRIAETIGEFPLIVRPAFTPGGTGGGIAYNRKELESICKAGLTASITSQVLVEKSLLGWKEYELEVMRDLADNVVIICSIENIDPMGVHTGDSITVAPAQTLTDKEYQRLRDQAIAIIREIGVECGGSNVQFAVNPKDGEVMVIEMNPRVSRSSALASKATGFPIAKIAAKLSVGYTLDQIPNDITRKTPASFEPSIDYVVTKIPRFAFEKFPGSQAILSTQMKSVGEAMAIGRTFQESFQKAMRSLETGHSGWGCEDSKALGWDVEKVKYSLRVPNPERMYAVYAAMKRGMSLEEIHELSLIDPWFLGQLKELLLVEEFLCETKLTEMSKEDLYEIKRRGFSDRQVAYATKTSEAEVRAHRLALGVLPAYKRVDTCAAEFEANTPYMYSSYDDECEASSSSRKKVLILGGQGIEFDYCCCHASFVLREAGYETIMMNSNPETVSTDYDTSDRLFFEPLTAEDVLNVIDLERPDGIIVQFGGQTPLKLAVPIQKYLDEFKPLAASGEGLVKIWGTSPDSIDASEDRRRFGIILNQLGIQQPPGGIARSEEDALAIAKRVGFPVVVRPSYVLGGRAMEIVYSNEKLKKYLETAVEVDPDRPVLVDKYLTDSSEIDVDCLADGNGNVVIGGIMEHIEQAGVHSEDSACSISTQTIAAQPLKTIREVTIKLAKRLNVCGLMNCQYAITQSGEVYVIEAHPRASRTVPFVSKAIGHPLAKYAALVMSGKSLDDLKFNQEVIPRHVSVKEAVLPFDKFQGCDVLLGPEMRSTGEVMGIDYSFGRSTTVSSQNAARNVLQKALKEQELSIFTKDDFSRLQSAGFVTKEAFEAVAQDRLFLEQALPGRVAHQAIIARAFAPTSPRFHVSAGSRLSSYTHRRIAGVGLAVDPIVNYFVQPDIETLGDDLQAGGYSVLVGQRQSGKSTAAQALMRRLSNGGVVWPIYLGGLADADSKWTNTDMWGTLIQYMRVACPEHFGDAAGSDAVAFMSMFQKRKLKTPVCLILDEADSLLNMPTGCLDSFVSTVREVKQSRFNYNLRSFLLVGVETVKDLIEGGYRRTLLEGPRRLSPFPHDYIKVAPGFSLDDIVDLLDQVNMDYNGAVEDVQRIASAILGITCGHKGLVGTCLAFILRMRLFTYRKWVEHIDSYDLGTYVFGQATYNRIVENFKMRARTPDGYELLIGFLEEVERPCNPIMLRDLLAEGILAVKRVDAVGQCYVGISSPLLLTAMLRECEIKSERVEAAPRPNVVDRKWVIGKVVQTMDMKVITSLECQNKSGPAEYALQFAFMCRLKAVLRQAYPLVPLVVLPEVKEQMGTQDQRSQRRLDTLVKDGSRFGFEFLVYGDKKTLGEYLERAKIYHRQHLAQVFLTNFSIDVQAEELRPDHDGITYVGVTFDCDTETVTLRFLDFNGCRDDVKLAMKGWDGRPTF